MKKRILSLVLCAAMLLSMCLFLGAGVTNSLTVCDSSGEAVKRVDLPVNQKISLMAQAQSAAENDAYQWQIRAAKNVWANILGSDTQTLELSYPMVASALSEKNTVQIRCRLTSAETGEATFSDAVTVEVTAATAVDTPASADAAAAPVLRSPAKVAVAANDAPEYGTYTIIINYKFEDGRTAANSWSATVANGATYTQDVTSPTVVGYAPDQPVVQVNASEETTYTVYYKPAEVEFTVKYYQQNVGDDKYMLSGTVTKRGYTEAPVSKYATGADGFDVNYDGFTRLLYDGTATIAADGSTVVELYYDRNYYLMNFDLDGGYGVEPIYARYDAPINVGTPTKPGYSFDSWEPELPTTMPVTKALDLYAKWSSNTLMEYTIHYKLRNGDTTIAQDTKGSALAGSTKTFEAKTGDQLNDGYRSGYFPETSSHSITMDIEGTAENGKNDFTFYYVQKDKVKYTVRYLEKGTNTVLHPEKTGETPAAVITEKFEQIQGYAPDAYQKRLVLSANDKENVLVFWYTEDTVHAPVQIVHEIQNIEGDGYTEYQSSTNLNGVIGEKYDGTPLTIPGFSYNESASTASGKLTAAGLVLTLKYDRIKYPYEFRFLEQGTDTELWGPVTDYARYQAQVTETAKTIPGYELVSGANSQSMVIQIEDPDDVASKNVKTFYYREQTVDIKYVAVGFGTLDKVQDSNVKVLSGTVQGSTPTPKPGYKFVGWYKDEGCTQQVDKTWVNTDTNKLTPQKSVPYGNQEGYRAATYYAKFERDVFDLTIEKKAANGSKIDQNQTFVFRVQGEGVNMQVVITGPGEQTIKNLPVGNYTITEDTSWSWKYTPDGDATQELKASSIQDGVATVTFKNKNNGTNWLTSLAQVINTWATGKAELKK